MKAFPPMYWHDESVKNQVKSYKADSQRWETKDMWYSLTFWMQLINELQLYLEFEIKK